MAALALRLALPSLLVVFCACAPTCDNWQARVDRKCGANPSSNACLKFKWRQCMWDCLEDIEDTREYPCAQHVGYTYDCARIQRKWTDTRCADADRKERPYCKTLGRKFVMTGCPKPAEAESGESAASEGSSPKVCPSDYHQVSGYCFTFRGDFYGNVQPWNKDICGEDAHLAVVDNQNFATILTDTLGAGLFWVGGVDQGGEMVWVDGQPMSSTPSGLWEPDAMPLDDAVRQTEKQCAVFNTESGQMLIANCDGYRYSFLPPLSGLSICQVDLN